VHWSDTAAAKPETTNDCGNLEIFSENQDYRVFGKDYWRLRIRNTVWPQIFVMDLLSTQGKKSRGFYI
jgi:hypothetical protein